MKSISFKDRASIARRVTWIGIFWNSALIIIKFFAGLAAHSNALIADAFHSVSDFGSDIAVLISVRLSNRPVDDTHHYGHGKIETLASILITIFLFFVAAGILFTGLKEIYFFYFYDVHIQPPGFIALIAAIISIIVKEGLYRYTIFKGKSINSPALVANAWHHRSDAFTSVAVSIGIAGAYFLGEHFAILDPIAAILVAVFILSFVYTSFKEALNELLEASLEQETNDLILKIAASVPGVNYPHNLKTRRIGNTISIELHLKVEPTLTVVEAHEIATNVEERLKEEFGRDIFISTHIEPYYLQEHLK